MPRTEEANQRIRDAQRAKILDAARKVFARKGYGATMADVAAAAGVSQGLAYRYFAGKETIFRELVQQTSRSGVSTLQHILDMPGTPGERLHFLISLLFRNRPEGLEYYQLVQQALNDETIPNDLRELLLRPGQTLPDVLRQLIVEGQASREVAPGDPDQLVIIVIACFDGFSRLALRDTEHVRKHRPDPDIILRLLRP